MFKVKKFLLLIFIFSLFITESVFASSYIDEIDILRASLFSQKDKTSAAYIKNKEKLNKLINQAKFSYTPNDRMTDVNRLINQHKYNSAMYELNDLIDNNIETSVCNELIGDIYSETYKNPAEIAPFYKKALELDSSNASASFKLAKLYLREKKNVLGIQYLKNAIELSNSPRYFAEAEEIILNKVHPNDRYDANNLYEALGLLYLKSGRNTDSYNAFATALELNPDDIYIKYMLANLLYIDNKAQNAIVVYDSILKDNPNDSQIRISKAKLLYKTGNLLNAQKEYLDILKKYPDSNQAKYGIYLIYKDNLTPGEIMMKIHGDNPKYKLDLNEIASFAKFLSEINEQQASSEFYNYISDVKEIERQRQEAQRQAEEAKRLAELERQAEIQRQAELQKQAAIKRQAEIQRQTELQKQAAIKKQEAKAKETNKKVQSTKTTQSNQVKTDVTKNNTLNNKTPEKKVVQKKSAEKKQTAKKVAEKKKIDREKVILNGMNDTLELDSNQNKKTPSITQEMEKKRIQEQKKIEELENKLNEINEKNTQKTQKFVITNELLQNEIKKAKTQNNKKFQEYSKIIDNYLKNPTKNAMLYIAVANTYKQANMPYHAIKYYEEAKKLEPLNSEIYYNIGLIYMEQNMLDNSCEYLNKALDLNKDNTKAQTLLNFINQKLVTSIVNSAYDDFENKKYLEAYFKLDAGLNRFPENAQLYYYRALACDALNRNAAAIMDFQKAIELNPTYYMAYYNLAKSYEKINDYKSAMVSYERFLSIEPDEPELIKEVENKVTNLAKKYY